jgi:hypothetical protein
LAVISQVYRTPNDHFRRHREARAQRIDRFLEDEAWPQIPDEILGRPISKNERETVLGLRPEGV